MSVSPLSSDAPDLLGAQWVPIRPNTDTALMLAMAHTLLAEEPHDKDFSRAIAPASRRSRAICSAATATPKTRTGRQRSPASPPTIRDLARRAAATRSMITCAWSLQRAHHGEQPYWAAITLAAMLGGIGLPGGGFAFGHGSINGIGVPRADLPGPEVPPPPNPARNAIPVARIADMLLEPGGATSSTAGATPIPTSG